MNHTLLVCLTGGGLIMCYYLVKILSIGRRPKDLPPGPPTLPLLGNLHQMPAERVHVQFQKWAEEYGPIYSLMLGTKTFIILSTPTAIKDLLDKRSNIYSSRPDLFLGHDVVGNGMRFVTMKYGSMWRSVHKMMHNTLNISTAAAYIPYQDLENKDMMVAFLDHPDDYVSNVRRYTTSLTTQMVYGYRTTSRFDPRLLGFFENFEAWSKIIARSSAQVLDLYPILRHLPAWLIPSYRDAKVLAEKERALYMENWTASKARIQNGTAHPCFSFDVLKAQKSDGFSDEQAAYIAGSLLEGGSDTTSGILVGFIQAMMMFPEVQKKAQDLLDDVVGPERLPTLDDCAKVHYIQAIVKETIRWMPTIITGSPHANIQEDYYNGYRIPINSSIVNNVWTVNMDPKRNPNPRNFDPERFANDFQTEHQSATNKDENTRQNWIFGAGRRLCQGMHIAERSLLMGVSRMLWGFTFERGLDENGNVIPVDIDDLVGGIAVQPRDFKIRIIPRPGRAEVIRAAWRDAEENLLHPDTKQWIQVPEGMKFTTLVAEEKS